MVMSVLSNASVTAPKLKWATYFGSGVSLGAWTGGPTTYSRTITGTDAVSHFNMTTDIESYFGSNAVPNLYAQPLEGDSTEITTTIQATSMTGMPSGAQELRIEASNIFGGLTNASKPQGGFQIKRAGTDTTADPEYMFCRKRFTTQSDFLTAMASGTNSFTNLYDDKTGLYGGVNTVGDIRRSINAVYGLPAAPTGITIRTRLDNNANGDPTAGTHIPSVGDLNFSTGGYSGNIDVAVPMVGGRQYVIELFVKFPQKIWTRQTSITETGATGYAYEQDTTTGRTVAVLIDCVTGIRYLLADIQGGQQNGNENLPVSRFLTIMYCNGGRTIADPGPQNAISFSGIEYWDYMPYDMLAGF